MIEGSSPQTSTVAGFVRTEAREALRAYFMPLTALMRLVMVLLSGATHVEIRPSDRR